ncbi:MAG: homoserine O-acetyltransferase [Parvibaculaceae bacterium]
MGEIEQTPPHSAADDDRLKTRLKTRCETVTFGSDRPLTLDCGVDLSPITIAYNTYGTLNAEKTNAVLVCHALTGDQHAANPHPATGKDGWWHRMIGPGKPIDTDRFFVLCPNVIGGCQGTTGPESLNPATGKPYGLDFPVITIADMVRAQALLIDHLGIDTLFCVAGGSMGGMQALQWASAYPDRVFSAIPLATAARHSAQNIAFHEVGRQAIQADPDWHGGAYYEHGTRPQKGLAVARMAAHITYMSESSLFQKFDRNLQDREEITYGFGPDFQIESYLRHQGFTFVDRFDANSYLYITRAMDYFDLAADHEGSLPLAFKETKTRFCIVSFTSDWHYPTSYNKQIVHALNAVAANVSFVEIESDKGHDAFLLEEPEMFSTLRGFIDSAASQRGLQ